MNRRTIELKWTTSRGRDTYGYNIVSLWENGTKKTSCNGGGYDMEGTAFGMWLEKEYQERLIQIADRAHIRHENSERHNQPYDEKQLYGMTAIINAKDSSIRISLDGACGFNSMHKIAKAIGINLERLWRGKSSDNKLFIVHDTENPPEDL